MKTKPVVGFGLSGHTIDSISGILQGKIVSPISYPAFDFYKFLAVVTPLFIINL